MKKRGMTLTELLVVIGVITLLLLVLLPVLRRARFYHFRVVCGNNLSQIAKGLLIYDHYHNGRFPRAGGRDGQWGATADFRADSSDQAFADGRASISANFFFLLKYADVEPESFLCKGDTGASEFDPNDYNVRNKKIDELWDFGPDPSRHCSYSYHMPYGEHSLGASSCPGMPVAADRNPWLPTPGRSARSVKDFQAFTPNGDRKTVKRGNALEHQEDGQNVLYADGHVSFEIEATCGLDLGDYDDNIYNSFSGDDRIKDALPMLTSQPADPNNSLLVHDPPIGDKK